jgi:PAS domain S-box-containing protein
MKRNIFYWVFSIRLLIVIYILLLIFAAFLGYQQDNQTQNGSIHINAGAWYVILFLLLVLALAIGDAIRKLKHTNKALAQRKNMYRSFVHNTREIIIQSDSNGRILFVNRAFKDKIGYSDSEIRKLTISDVFAEETKSVQGDHPIFFQHDEQKTSINVFYKTKSGEKVYLEGNVVFNYKDGTLKTTETFLRDTTQLRALHDDLLASESKYRAFFDLSPVPEYFFDTTTMEFVEVNPAAVKKYGYSREEFLKMTIYDLRRTEGEEKERFHSCLGSLRNGGSSYEAKTRHYKKSGQPVDVEVSIKAIELMNREMYLVVAIDVTKKEQREREMNQAILKAQEKERQEIGTELHDNIGQILTSSQLLLDTAKRSESLESIKLIDRSRQNITEVLNEIRNLSHRMAPIFFEIDSFEAAVNDLLLNMNPDGRYDIEVDFDQKIVSESVSPDIQLNLYRILQEQLKNIVKYAKASSIKVGLSLHNDVIRMYIIDNGVGFDIARVKKGIGLINIQRRAELFCGKFSINTSPGKGCQLFIELRISANDLNKN